MNLIITKRKILLLILFEIAILMDIGVCNEKDSNIFDDFGQKVNKRRRQLIPTKHVTEKSILDIFSEDQQSADTSEPNSRAIDNQHQNPFRDRAAFREHLRQKLKLELQPKANLSNQTLLIDGLSVSTKQLPSSLSSLKFDRKLLNQLGSLLPGGRPRDNVDDIHAELQGMLFGENSYDDEEDNVSNKNAENLTNNTDLDEITTVPTSSENDEEITLYDLYDYVDYTEDNINIENKEESDIETLDLKDGEEEMDYEYTSISNLEDQDASDTMQVNTNVPINLNNISSSSLPLTSKRRPSYVRFPGRQSVNLKGQNSLRSRINNKRRILRQQIRNEEISSRIMNKPANRRQYISEPSFVEDDYSLDYEGK